MSHWGGTSTHVSACKRSHQGCGVNVTVRTYQTSTATKRPKTKINVYAGEMDFDSRFGRLVRGCENAIGYIFTDKRLCAEALNAAGPSGSWYVDNGSHRTLPKNDRLAVYGDSVAAPVLCRRWYLGNQNKGMNRQPLMPPRSLVVRTKRYGP